MMPAHALLEAASPEVLSQLAPRFDLWPFQLAGDAGVLMGATPGSAALVGIVRQPAALGAVAAAEARAGEFVRWCATDAEHAGRAALCSRVNCGR